MILAAGLRGLLGLGFFVGGVLSGVTWLYWACVAACAAAAVLTVIVRHGMLRPGMPAAPPGKEPARAERATGAAPAERSGGAPQDSPDPDVEDVEVTDLLLVVDLKDEVFVLDERPRYHLAGCVHLQGRTPIPLPHDEARTDGFTPCAVCEPDHTLADQVRARKAAKGS